MKKIYIALALVASSFALSAQQLPNNSFENWGSAPYYEPTGWFTFNFATASYPSYGAIKDTDAYDGLYSLKLRSDHFDLTPFGWPIVDTMAYAAIGSISQSGPIYGVPFTGRPVKLTFYYKYTPGTPQGNDVDTARVYVRFGNNGNTIGDGEKKIYGAAVNTWTYGEITINWTSASNPDTCKVELASSLTGILFSTDDINTNLIGNELKIDKLEFIYQTTSIEDNKTKAAVSVYPNPSSDVINVQNVSSNASYVICDALGNTVAKGQFSTGCINVSALAQGMYFLQVFEGNQKTVTKFTVK
ncbi:MAG: hypothetical protein Fur0041_03030 [Bacteroidia bacterium]